MRIAVLGSWRESDRVTANLVDRPGFFPAAAALGREIVRLGHSLIVGSDVDHTADYHAARGAVAALRGDEEGARIHILAPRSRETPFAELRRQAPRAFSEQFIPVTEWISAKVFQVREADGVVILGGAQQSRQAGLTAAVSNKRLVCIGSFGGAARELNELFMLSRASWSNSLPSDSDLGVFQNPWSDFLCSRATLSLRIDNKPRILIVHGRSDDRLELKNYLQNSLGLPEPVILAERISPGEVLPVKFEGLAADVDGAIALGTPDDFGGLVPKGRAGRGTEP